MITASAAGCDGPQTATHTVTITELPIATFEYTDSPYCQSGVDPGPNFLGGGVAGTFTSAPAGLVINAATGVIDLSASTPNTYTVTNTISAASGCPDVIETATLTISTLPIATFEYTDSPFCQSGVDPAPNFLGSGVAGTFTSAPAGLVINAATGVIDLSASTPNTYTVTNTIFAASGCPDVIETATVTITALPIATFEYTDSPFCQSGVDPAPNFLGGGIAGTFTSAPAGLVINAATGVIDLSASTPNTYTVTNTISAASGCPDVIETVTVTISTLPIATFEYTDSPFCQSGVDPAPNFLGGGVAGTFTSAPAGLVINAATGVIDLSASTPNTYTVTNTIFAASGCPDVIETATVTITTLPIATFEYTDSPFCQSGVDPAPNFLGGGVAGTFTSAPAGLVINAATGVIDLSASTPNTYTVTNTISAASGCPDVIETATVTITTLPIATFEYTDSPFCQSGVDPAPNFLGGGVAGTFTSAPAGLVINAATGVIDLSASTPNTYTVTNTIFAASGCPDVIETATLTITALPIATFEYTDSPFCQSGVDPAPNFLGGGVAGTFTSAPAGLVINAATGVIDLSASTPNTYTVTNTIFAASGCPDVIETVTLTISTLPIATFEYTDSPFCQSGVDPAPNFLGGGVAGTFTSAPAGLVINAATGVIDLSASTPNTYTVTNTIFAASGCPDVIETATVTITTLPIATFEYTDSPFCQSGVDPAPNFLGGGVAGTFTSAPAGLVINAATGVIDLSASTPNTYTVTNTISAASGCPDVIETATVTITALPIATFEYTDSPFCQSGVDPAPNFLGGGVAGTFTSAPAGLVINAATGVIDLSASTPNTYTVTNTISAASGCPDVIETATVTITTLPIATFEYTDSPFCQSGVDPAPNFLGGGVAGTFTSAPAGLVINAATGVIDLSASTPNTYTVTNTISAASGCPDVIETATVTITTLPIATFEYTDSPFCQSGVDPAPNFLGGGVAGAFTSAPAGLVINAATGVIDLSASTPNTYTVTNTISAASGCPDVIETATVTITTLPIATFEYTDSPFCQSGVDPAPNFLGGGVAGTFTSAPAGLVINAATGVIDLSASTPNTYTVTNTISAASGCPDVIETATVTITTLPVATFEYTDSPSVRAVLTLRPIFLAVV